MLRGGGGGGGGGWQMTREIRHRERGSDRKRTMVFAMTKSHFDETGVVRGASRRAALTLHDSART